MKTIFKSFFFFFALSLTSCMSSKVYSYKSFHKISTDDKVELKILVFNKNEVIERQDTVVSYADAKQELKKMEAYAKTKVSNYNSLEKSLN